VLLVALVVAASLILSGCFGPKKEPKKVKKPKPVPSKTVAQGKPLTVGSFKYELLRSYETTMIGPPGVITSSKARGKFVVLEFQAELVSDHVRSLDRREITVVDAKGKVYQSSLDAQGALKAQGKANLFKQDTTYRGIPVQGWVAFDVSTKADGLRIKIINLFEPKAFEGYIALPATPAKP